VIILALIALFDIVVQAERYFEKSSFSSYCCGVDGCDDMVDRFLL